jgi:hypothetical protein
MSKNGEGLLTNECDKILKLPLCRVSSNSDPIFTMVQHRISRPKPTASMVVYEKSISIGTCIEDHELLSINGWLSTDGVLYSCSWQQHSKTVTHLGFSTEREAVNSGFIKLSEMHWHIEKRFGPVTLTDSQSKTIKQWHQNNGLDETYFNKTYNGRTEYATP